MYLENRPGALARTAQILSKASVNIEGISAAQTSDMTLVQLITSNPVKARKALKTAGVPFTVQDVAILMLDDKPGALANVATELAANGVNINFLYGTAGENGNPGSCLLVLGADDLSKLRKTGLRASKGLK